MKVVFDMDTGVDDSPSNPPAHVYLRITRILF